MPAGHGQIARPGGPNAQHDGVEIAVQFFHGNVHADLDAGQEMHAGRDHYIDTPLHQRLAELHVGDTEHQQPAGSVGPFENRHFVTDRVQLLGAGQPRRRSQ